MTRHLKAGFTGYYGMSNFGDDLFAVLCAAAARRYWNCNPLLVGPPLAEANCKATMPRKFPAALYGGMGLFGKLSRFYSFARAAATSDVLVMGGGSVITGRDSFRAPLMRTMKRLRHLQLAAVGVSIGPFDGPSAESAAAAFMDNLRYIAVRDQRSYEAAVRMGFGDRTCHGRDLAGLLPMFLTDQPQPVATGTEECPLRIGLAPCNYAESGRHPLPSRKETHAAVVQALTHLANTMPIEVEVYSLNEHPAHGDIALADDLQRMLEEGGVRARRMRYRDAGPMAVARQIGNCDGFISARLHGAIVAYVLGIPFTIIDYHPKCRDFSDDVGLPEAVRITAHRHDADAFGQAIAAMLDGGGRPAVSRDVYMDKAQDIFRCAPWVSPIPN